MIDINALMYSIADLRKTVEPSHEPETFVCMHCYHVLRLDGVECPLSLFIPKQVLNPQTMEVHKARWKYCCGVCGGWGFEVDIDDALLLSGNSS